MLKSMTGFGKAIVELENKKVTIEIKSLNSKQLDLSTRIPSIYKEKDLYVRNLIKNKLERGKIEFCIYLETIGVNKDALINKEAVKHYYNQLNEVGSELGINTNSDVILSNILRLPETLKQEREELDESEWGTICLGINKAIEEIENFRIEEGKALEIDIFNRISIIELLLAEVPKYEAGRIEVIKTRINEKLNEFVEKQNINQDRFEQEVIYFLEKLDITEEKVRLSQHCKYFIETAKNENSVGKKLGFISQEIGREINTLGSKANDADLQKIVIQMKDELEKIKEQILNVL